MSDNIKTVMLVGSGGILGKPILNSLLAYNKFTVSVVSRETTSMSKSLSGGIKLWRSDFSASDLANVFAAQDVVICALGGSAVELQKKVILAAAKAGVKRFIPSEFGSDVSNARAREAVPLYKEKSNIIDYLVMTACSYPNFSWTAITTGPFFDWGLKHGSLGFDLQSRTATIFGSGDQHFSTSTICRVAQSVVATLANFDETKNKRLFVASFTTSQNEILTTIENITGAKWTIKQSSSEAMANIGRFRLSKGDVTGDFFLMVAALFNEEMGNNFEIIRTLHNNILKLPNEDLIDIINQITGNKL